MISALDSTEMMTLSPSSLPGEFKDKKSSARPPASSTEPGVQISDTAATLPSEEKSLPVPLVSPKDPGRLSSHMSLNHEAGVSTPVSAIPRAIPFFLAVCSSNLLSLACLGQALVPASIIAQSFNTTSPAESSWFSASYTLTAGTFILVAGRAGDIWGHKRLLLVGYAWLALWSLLAGLSVYSASIVFFDVCRAMQGVGSALTLPNAIALLGRAYPSGDKKNKAFAIFGACAPNGFLLGALFASFLAQLLWWPWGYWILAILAGVLVGVVMLFVPDEVEGLESTGSKGVLDKMDWIGCLTGVFGLVLANLSWNLAPVYGWSKPYVIVCLILGVLLLGTFAWNEGRTISPILPFKSISRDAVFVLLIIGLCWSSFGQAIFYYFQFTQRLRNSTALGAVAQISGSSLSGLFAAMTAGFLLSKIRVSIILLLASVAFCAGNILAATLPLYQSYWKQAFWIQIVMPFGMDMSFPAAAVIMSDLVPKDQQGIAGSLVVTVINYSISIGLGVAGTVASEIKKGGGEELEQFRGAWWSGVGLSGCGILVALYFAFVFKKIIPL